MKRVKEMMVDAGVHLFVYGVLAWLFLLFYSAEINPVSQVVYAAKDINCKIEMGTDWEAGENGCYRKANLGFAYTLRKAFGG